MPTFGLVPPPSGPSNGRYLPSTVDQNNVPGGVLFDPGTLVSGAPVIGLSSGSVPLPFVGNLPEWTTYLPGMSGVVVSHAQPSIYSGASYVSDRFLSYSAADLAAGTVGPFDILCQSTYTMNGTMPTATNMPFSAIIQSSQTWNVNPQAQAMGCIYVGGTFQMPAGFTGNADDIFVGLKFDDLIVKGPTGQLNALSNAYVIQSKANIALNCDQIILAYLGGNVGGGGLTNKFQGLQISVQTNSGSTFTESMGWHIGTLPTGISWTYGLVMGYDGYFGGHNVIGASQGPGLPASAGVYGIDIRGAGDYGTVGMYPVASLGTLPASGNMSFAHYTGVTSGHTFFLIVKNNAGTLSYTSLDLTALATTWVNSGTLPT